MSDIILYTTEDGATKIDLRLEDGTVWLSQLQIADLFQTSKHNISIHTKNIFEDGELTKAATVKESLTVRKEGAREVQRTIELYNLDLILAVGYKVNSERAVQFRKWATGIIKEFTIKAYVSTKGASRYQHSPSGYVSCTVRNIGLKDRRMVCMAETSSPPSFGLSDLVADFPFNIALRTMLVSDRSFGAGEQHMHFAAPTVRPHTIRENSCPLVLRSFSEVGFVVEKLTHKERNHDGGLPEMAKQ